MGANCCVAVKERSQPCVASVDVSAYRIRHSPSWSFRWDNRTHIEDIMENTRLFSDHSSGNIQPELKSDSITPTEGHSNEDSLSDVICKTKWPKSEKKREASKLSKAGPHVQSTANNAPLEENSHKSLDMVAVASDIKISKSLPATPPLVSRAEPSPARSHSLQMDSNSTRKANRSPGHQLYRQISDWKATSLRLFNESKSAEGRPSSSMLSACNNDPFAEGSHGSSDGCSTSKFSQLVALSQRERWSVASEPSGSIANKITRSNVLSPDQELCKLCSALLKERSTWNAHELAVAAVLFCGHAYHANCLDEITAEYDKYDPPCPVCIHGEECAAKLFGKLNSKIKNKRRKNVIADTDLEQNSRHQKKGTRESMLGTSSSMKDSFSRPSFSRHFSFGSRPSRSASVSVSTGKKGFWARHWKE